MQQTQRRPNWLLRGGVVVAAVYVVSSCLHPAGTENLPAQDGSSSESTHQAVASYVLGISIDGLGSNAIEKLGDDVLPNFSRLMSEGSGTLNARSDYNLTETLPNHTGMLTGRTVEGEDGHHVTDNKDTGKTIQDYAEHQVPSIFDVIHDRGGSTGLYTSKEKFDLIDRSYDKKHGAKDTIGADNGRDKLDTYKRTDLDDTVSTYLDDLESANDPDQFALLHIADPDIAGHANDYAGKSYLKAVEHSDELLGKVMDKVEADDRLKGHMILIVTADHGGHNAGNPRSHDDNKRIDNYKIPFFVWGGSDNDAISAGKDLYEVNNDTRTDPGNKRIDPDESAFDQPIRNADMANLALDLLGLPAVNGSNVDQPQDLAVHS